MRTTGTFTAMGSMWRPDSPLRRASARHGVGARSLSRPNSVGRGNQAGMARSPHIRSRDVFGRPYRGGDRLGVRPMQPFTPPPCLKNLRPFPIHLGSHLLLGATLRPHPTHRLRPGGWGTVPFNIVGHHEMGEEVRVSRTKVKSPSLGGARGGRRRA